MNAEYPVCLNLIGKKCLVVGGGSVAERKVKGLMDSGALLTLISPQLSPQLQEWVRRSFVSWRERAFQPGDAIGFYLVFCATNSPEVNRQVAMEARNNNTPVNVADAPEMCDFTIPAAVRSGDITIAVSTNGKSPAVARELRKELTDHYGSEYGEYLEIIATIRREWLEAVEPCACRQSRWRDLEGFDPEVLRLLRAGRRKEAEERVRDVVGCSGSQS